MQETRRRVLDALSDGPVTGPELAEQLDVSRAAVWKHVEALREADFEVEGTDEGYVLQSIPEYGGAAIEYGLEAPFEVEFHDSLGSTNERARELAADGATDTVVVAAEQTGGRGRLDREWSSPAGGVWLSVLCRPDLPPAQVPVYTLAAAVAVTRAAREAGVEARIKWPNDVLVPVGDGEDAEERKLCGILTEMEGEADRVSWVVVGIGVNVNFDESDLPPEANATTLRAARERAGHGADEADVPRRLFVQRLLETFDELRAAPERVLPAWREYASTLGRRVRVETPGGEVVGEAVDIEFPGTLVVETDEGTRRVSAGDCEHLRPAE
ncbi:biotin--[acetyl-CoA-carboxylase] ligase [Haloglomus halophilum]|uniref:biotin--[acetyl-CoA-carboxylase] ligase n=1 Tax=Haloglomus halophilum TaxID=2962672 RepID=UPI0020C9B0CF|nr:biotin--[acetyl-CoA-carboxylase] ligase [Haloglomus halophilum]